MAHEPHTKATFARARLIGQLRANQQLGAAALAAIVAACTDTAPCQSAACPVCGLAFQRAAVALVEEFIDVPAREIRHRTTAITIVPASGCIPPDALTVGDFQRVGAEIAAAFTVLDLPPTIIGLEASFNEDTTGRFDDHWCVHTHANQLDWLSDRQEASLKEAFPRSPFVKQPVRCDKLDRRSEGRRYPFKFERVRRVTVFNTDHPTRAPFRESKRRELRPDQAVNLAIVEHRLGFARRHLTHGIDERLVRQRLHSLGWARDGP